VFLGGAFLLGAGFAVADLDDRSYSPSSDVWWRLGEREGTLTFETSPDGSTWKIKGSIEIPFRLDEVQIEIGAGTYQPNIPPGQAHFDCYNVPAETCP
jgi:hypothetical protein